MYLGTGLQWVRESFVFSVAFCHGYQVQQRVMSSNNLCSFPISQSRCLWMRLISELQLFTIEFIWGINLKSESKTTPRFLAVGVCNMLLPRISLAKEDATTLIAYEQQFVFLAGFNFNFFLYIQSLTQTREFWRFWIELSKLDMLKELWTCVISI